MADLFNTMSSLLGKLKPAKAPEPQEATRLQTLPAPQASNQTPLPDLGAMDELQLKEFLSQQPERAITRILQSLTDAELQLRVIQCTTDEAALKRVSRSELSKKLKRAAEKQLRETGSGSAELKAQKLAPLRDELQAFFRKPDWETAPELLARVDEPLGELGNESTAESKAVFADFQELRTRLKREVGEYDKTVAEMEMICDRLDAARPLSKGALAEIKERFNDLEEKYSFPKNFDVIQTFGQKFQQAIEFKAAPAPKKQVPQSRPTPPPVEQLAIDAAAQEKAKAQREEAAVNEARRRQGRLDAVETLLKQIRELESNLAERQVGARLRELQNKATALRRWKREYPAQLDEAEALIKTLSTKRTEVVNEAKWDSWARTDLAIRIQTELEKTISELEAETDADAALMKSTGLTERLFEYAKEMRALGSLERGKDHKIWEQFKALSARGWVVCDKMRALVVEKLKTELAPLASREIDFSVAALTHPRLTIGFKPGAFEDSASAHLKELQNVWSKIGVKPTELNREVETVGSKLFEIYFRQSNLHFGKIRRSEAEAIHEKRTLLQEMKVTCEGKSSLLARTRVAKSLEERWKKSPLPESVAATLQSEFEGYQVRLAAELTEEVGKAVAVLEALHAQAESTRANILAKTGTSLSQALKQVAALDADLKTTEKHLAQFAGLKEAVPAFASFEKVRDRLLAVFNECKSAAQKETSERAQERNQVLSEAQTLALSTDWLAATARFEELKALWKKVGVLAQKQDPLFDLIFENMAQFYRARAASKDQVHTAEQKEKGLKTRQELLYSLDALARFQQRAASRLPGPTIPPGKLLELGMKYKQILSLDPQGGTHKETRKVMDQWGRLGTPDDEAERLSGFWAYYLDRIRVLLEIA